MLLNLMAALSLASIGAVAGIASISQSVDGSELDKSSLIERKDATVVGYDEGDALYGIPHASLTDDVFYDGVLHFYDASDPSVSPGGLSPSAATYKAVTNGIRVDVGFVYGTFVPEHDYLNDFSYYIDGNACVFSNGSNFVSSDDYPPQLRLVLMNSDNAWLADVDWDNARLTILKSTYTWADYEASHQIVSGIASGLTSVQHYATSLVSGFDALALDNGALTNSMAFAFTLLGIGTAVGICKLTFNWITGRHGM